MIKGSDCHRGGGETDSAIEPKMRRDGKASRTAFVLRIKMRCEEE
jgi:hypothetical protein